MTHLSLTRGMACNNYINNICTEYTVTNKQI